MLSILLKYTFYWAILTAISLFIHLFWLSPKELKGKFTKLFPKSIMLTIIAYLVLFIILPFSLPRSIKHLIIQIYKTYKQ